MATWYSRGLLQMAAGSIDWTSANIDLLLLDNTATLDPDDQYVSDINGDEVTGTGYTAGGQDIANRTRLRDTTNNRTLLRCDNVTWAALTPDVPVKHAVAYLNTGNTATSTLLFGCSFASDQDPAGGPLEVDFGSNTAILTCGTQWYSQGLFRIVGGEIDWASDDIDVLLLTSSATIDPDDQFVSDISADEVSGTGYARKDTSGRVLVRDTGNDRLLFNVSVVVFTALTPAAPIKHAVFYKNTGVDSTSDLLFAVTFASNQDPAGAPFSFSWSNDRAAYFDNL